MAERSIQDVFIGASPYTAPVDIKKLKFIFREINDYAGARNKALESLRILEVACGDGGITFSLAALGCQVRAFDIDKGAVGRVLERANREGIGNLAVTVDNGCTFDDGLTYDIVVASEVFEHVLAPSALAENIARRMTVGSYLIVTAPNGYGPWEMKNRLNPLTYLARWNWLRRRFGKPPYVYGGGPDHCQFFTKGRLVGLFAGLSFRLVRFAKSNAFLTIFDPIRANAFLGAWDIRLADALPYWTASGWYFVFEMQAP